MLRHVLCSFLLEAAKFTSKSRYVCRERELSQKSGAILRLLQWTFATGFPFVFHRCQFCRETQEFCNSRFHPNKSDKLWQHRKVSWLWFCARCSQHRVDLSPVVGLVVEEFNSTESLWLLDPR